MTAETMITIRTYLPTQIVAIREIQALLRFKPSQTAQAQWEVRLKLPELDTEYLINLGRLSQLSQILPNTRS
jgi:hypothetical protein